MILRYLSVKFKSAVYERTRYNDHGVITVSIPFATLALVLWQTFVHEIVSDEVGC